MNDMFEKAFNLLMGHEGEFSLDPKDRGNWTGGEVGKGVLKGTKFGISAATFPDLDIRNLTLAAAREIYRKHYWQVCRCDDMPPSVALLLFDGAVNCSPKKSVMWLQQALKIRVDGVAGGQTAAAAKAVRDVMPVLVDMLAFRNEHNRRAPSAADHGLGWSRRLFKLAFQSIYFNPS